MYKTKGPGARAKQLARFMEYANLPQCSRPTAGLHDVSGRFIIVPGWLRRQVENKIRYTESELRNAGRKIMRTTFPPICDQDVPRWHLYLWSSEKARHRGMGERLLLHTTRTVDDAYALLSEKYFDISQQRECSAVHGFGVNLGMDINQILPYVERNERKATLLCLAAVGKVQANELDNNVPGVEYSVPKYRWPSRGYDSLVDSSNDPDIIVVPDPWRVVPVCSIEHQ
jgi:hypothetical protein